MAETLGQGGSNRVVVSGVDIPFADLVVLIVKVVLASIPAYFIMFIFFSILFAIFGSMLMGMVGLGARSMF